MNYPDAIAWLYGTQLHGIKLGLENMRRLTDRLTLPAAGMRIIHAAGTNGKGSTCAIMDSLLRAAGHRTGLFTSPHLVTFRERIRVDGVMIPEQAAAEILTRIRDLVADFDPHPTFFEIVTALALEWFRQSGVEVAVMETGMGGRLDATNVLTPAVCVLTPVSFDHQQYLGETLSLIAGEKAGIIKPGVPVVSSPQEPEAMAVITAAAAECGAALTVIDTPLTNLPVALPGPHQQWNAALAVAALSAGGFSISDAALQSGLAAVEWPARFQLLEKGRLIIDGAHNPGGAAVLRAAWQERFPGEQAAVLFGSVSAQNHPEVLEILQDITAEIWLLPVDSARSIPPEMLASTAPSGLLCHLGATLPGALAEARATGRRVLICGSLYLCGEALSLLQGGDFESSLQ